MGRSPKQEVDSGFGHVSMGHVSVPFECAAAIHDYVKKYNVHHEDDPIGRQDVVRIALEEFFDLAEHEEEEKPQQKKPKLRDLPPVT